LPSPKLEGVDVTEEDGERFNIAIGCDAGGGIISFGDSGGVGCSSGLIDHCIIGSLCSYLSGMEICRGDSHCFPVLGEGCDSFQDGPPSRVNSSCFSNKGVVRMGAGRGG